MDAAIKRWRRRSGPEVVGALDEETGEYVLRARIRAQPPVEIGLLIGECAHALRSSLDHLAFRLAQAASASPLPDHIARTSEFPIFPDPDAYRRDATRKLKGVHPDAQTAIERMQPFHGGDWELLAFVHELDRIDKHRTLNVTVATVEKVQVSVRHARPLDRYTFVPPGPVNDGDHLVSYVAAPLDPRRPVRHRHAAQLGVAVAEGEFARWWVSDRLRAAETLIRERVIPGLAPYT